MDSSTPQLGTSSSFSSSSSTLSFTHDVFLSFRGPDTRNNFTGHLYRALVDNGINTFIDNDLTRGEDISNELLQVIEGSRISIVVFSTNYAYSKWCLDELVKILQCKESKQQIVYPIFYKVEPSEIKDQESHFGKGIANLISKSTKILEKVESWKAALEQAKTLAGWHITEERHEATVIDEIVIQISTIIMKYTTLDVAAYPVGIESRVEDILKLLHVGEDDPQMIGIWGIGGIGKTTLAIAVYNSITHKFEHSCFLENVREKSSSHEGLVKLQNDFLSEIIEKNPPKVTNIAEGISVLKQKLRHKRVLLVLDDVDHISQLRKLAGGCDWFGPRSRVIITTRDKNCLEAHNFKKKTVYEAKELNEEEALKLFNFNAFKGDKCTDDFSDITSGVVRYAKGIPLVLEVMGSDLCNKTKDEWKDALEYYRKYPNQGVQEILQRSYEALHGPMQEVFLHIACFFKGEEQSYVRYALQSCDLNPTFALKVLAEKALIKFQKGRIWMHDLLEDMGKEIVRQESPNKPEKRSRLWHYKDVCEVLENNKGTDKIRGIRLRFTSANKQDIRLNGRSFTNMDNLQFLRLDKVMFPSHTSRTVDLDVDLDVDYLPNQLRVIEWMNMHCPLRSLPTNFKPRKLGILMMQGSCVIPLLNEGFKKMPYLKSIHLWGCVGLERIPDLSRLTSLENLVLLRCDELVEVHSSVGRLDKLAHLDISYCVKLQKFQEKISLKSLETLKLSFCPLEFFPEIEGDMTSLSRLDLSFTKIKELPCSFGNLTGLKCLCLFECESLTNVPSSIFYKLQLLEDLDLRQCNLLEQFPTPSESPPPPAFLTNLTSLKVHLSSCERLKELSEFPREIDFLYVYKCSSLERISNLSKILEGKDSKMIHHMNLSYCSTLCDALADGVRSKVAVDKRKRMTSSEELMDNAEKLTALLSLFFSCATSEEFRVKFPATAPIPDWLNFYQDVKGDGNDLMITEHDFCIKFPQSSNWDNKGLALCISHQSGFGNEVDDSNDVGEDYSDDEEEDDSDDVEEDDSDDVEKDDSDDVEEDDSDDVEDDYDGEENRSMPRQEIYINEVRFHDERLERGHVWLHYIPMVTIMRRLSEKGMPPPDVLEVKFRLDLFEGSCGVQLIDDSAADLQYIWKMHSGLPIPDWQKESIKRSKS